MTSIPVTGTNSSSMQSNAMISGSTASTGQPLGPQILQGLDSSSSMSTNSIFSSSTSSSSASSSSVLSGSTTSIAQPLAPQILQGLRTSNTTASNPISSGATISTGQPLAPQILQGLGTGSSSVSSSAIPLSSPASTGPPYVFNGLSSALRTAPSNSVPTNPGISSSGAYRPPYGPPYGSQQATSGGLSSRPLVSPSPLGFGSGLSPVSSLGSSVTAPVFTLSSNSLLNASPSNLSYPITGPPSLGPSNSLAKPIASASTRIFGGTAPSNLPLSISVPLNFAVSNSLPGSAQPTITASLASNGTTSNATSTGGCFDWLGHPLPCNCPGAYSSGGYTSLVAITNIVTNTAVNPPIVSTEVLTETVGPPAIVPGQDTCGMACLIGASEVQILYWPITTGQANLSITAAGPTTPYSYVSNGFTFTSPSVYVAYRGLKASAAYNPFGEPLGSASHDVTVGYPPEALSTSHCNLAYTMSAQQYQPINYTELQYPPPNSAITDCPHASGQPDVGGAIYNPSASNEATNAFFSIPGALNWVDPAWSTCIPVTYGVFDPPKALSKAVQMVPQTVAGASGLVAETAAPGSSATPAAAPVTVAPGALGGVPVPLALSPASVLIPEPTSLSAAEGFDSSDTGSLVLIGTGSAEAFGFPGGNKAPSFLYAATALVPDVSVNEVLATPAPSNDPNNPPQQAPQQTTSEAVAPLPVVNTPSYNSVLMATPSSVVAAPTAAAQPAVSPVNAPVDKGPTVNPPAATAPGGNSPAGNAPVENAPARSAPAVNSPANNPPATVVSNPVVVASPSPVVVAGNTAAPASNGGVVIASSTYSPGSQATVGGQVISVGTNNIVQGGTTQNIPTQTEPTPVLVGGNSIESAPSGGVVIASSTYEPGVVAQVAGTPISVGSSNIIVASSTHAIPSIAAIVPQAAPVTSQAILIPTPVLVGGNSVVNAPGGGVVIASSTYQPGVQAQISGTPISVGTDNIAVDSSTYALPSAPSATPVLIGGSPIAKASSGGIVIAGSTYQPGVVAQVAGTPISVGSDNVVINSHTVGLPNAAPQIPSPVQTPAQTPVLVGGQSIVKASGGGVIIGSSTIAPGSEATVSGTVVTAGTNNVVVGGNNYALPDTAGATLQQQQAPAAQPQSVPAIVAGQTVSRASNGGVVVGSSTIGSGQQATISGQVISAGPSNVAIGGSIYTLPSTAGAILQTPAPQIQPQTTALVGGQSIARASNGGVVIGSSTIAPGSQATISGQVISAGQTNVAIGGSTYALPSTAGAVLQTPTPQPSTPVEVGGNSIVKAPNGGIVIGSSTIAPGSEATISGQVISAGPSHVAIDGSTYALPTSAGGVLETPAPQTEQVPVQVGGNSIARASNGGIIIGSSTLAPGSVATISGQVVSAGATNVAIGSSTYDLASTAGAVVQTPSPVTPSNAPVVVAGQTVARASNGGLVVGTSTIAPGAQATISGHVFSAAGTGATNIAIDGSNYALATTAGALLETPAPTSPKTAEAVVTLANGDIISAGGPAAVISGVTASVLGDDSGLVIGSKTIPLPPPSALTTSNAVYTVGGQTFTAAPSGLPISIDGTTLSPGGSPITISGTIVSLGDGALQIGSTIMPLPTAPSELFTVGGTTFAAAATGFAIGGTSLAPGGSAITISGTVVSLGTAGLQIGSSTIPLNAAELTAAADGLVSGIGATPTGFYNAISNSTSSTLLTSSATLSGPTPLTGVISPSQAATSTAKPKTGMASRFGSEIWMLMTVILGWSVGVIAFTM